MVVNTNFLNHVVLFACERALPCDFQVPKGYEQDWESRSSQTLNALIRCWQRCGDLSDVLMLLLLFLLLLLLWWCVSSRNVTASSFTPSSTHITICCLLRVTPDTVAALWQTPASNKGWRERRSCAVANGLSYWVLFTFCCRYVLVSRLLIWPELKEPKICCHSSLHSKCGVSSTWRGHLIEPRQTDPTKDTRMDTRMQKALAWEC